MQENELECCLSKKSNQPNFQNDDDFQGRWLVNTHVFKNDPVNSLLFCIILKHVR